MSPYRLLSLWSLARAVWRGPKAVVRNRTRAYAHRELARAMRRGGL